MSLLKKFCKKYYRIFNKNVFPIVRVLPEAKKAFEWAYKCGIEISPNPTAGV